MGFDNAPVLAQLMLQAEGAGADLSALRAIAEEAGELGAARALARLGLDDPAAARDMAELRVLLGAWRDAKRSAVKAALGWVVRMVLALVLVGLAVRMRCWRRWWRAARSRGCRSDTGCGRRRADGGAS